MWKSSVLFLSMCVINLHTNRIDSNANASLIVAEVDKQQAMASLSAVIKYLEVC